MFQQTLILLTKLHVILVRKSFSLVEWLEVIGEVKDQGKTNRNYPDLLRNDSGIVEILYRSVYLISLRHAFKIQ